MFKDNTVDENAHMIKLTDKKFVAFVQTTGNCPRQGWCHYLFSSMHTIYYVLAIYYLHPAFCALRIVPSAIKERSTVPSNGVRIWFNHLINITASTGCVVIDRALSLCIGSCSHDNLHLTTRPFPDAACVYTHKDSVPYPGTRIQNSIHLIIHYFLFDLNLTSVFVRLKPFYHPSWYLFLRFKSRSIAKE